MKRRLAFIGMNLFKLAGAGVYIALDNPGAPPAKLHRITRGMSSADVIAILGESTQHGFEGSHIGCIRWEKPRGMSSWCWTIGVSVMRTTKHQSELRRVWLWAVHRLFAQ